MGMKCDVCGQEFEARAGARYCSGRCRTIAYRRRTTPDAKPRRRPPLEESFRGTYLDADRLIRRWERILTDDRFPRNRPKLSHRRAELVRLRDSIDALLTRWPE